jgi:hypothetical protein
MNPSPIAMKLNRIGRNTFARNSITVCTTAARKQTVEAMRKYRSTVRSHFRLSFAVGNSGIVPLPDDEMREGPANFGNPAKYPSTRLHGAMDYSE